MTTWEVGPIKRGGGYVITNLDTEENLHLPPSTDPKRNNPLWTLHGMNRSHAGTLPGLVEPGDTVFMRPGDYPHFRVSKHFFETELQDISRCINYEAKHPGTVRLRENPVGGSQTLYVEWSNVPIRFSGIVFEGDDQRALGTENPYSRRWHGDHPGFAELSFINCYMDGEWDFQRMTGEASKWGCLTYGIEGGLTWFGGGGHGIKKEHFFYLHNSVGNVLMSGARFYGAGRTFLQDTARPHEGPAASGKIILHRVRAENTCLEMGGGGSSITIKGNRTGLVHISQCDILQGANPELLHPDVVDNITGCVVVEPNKYDEDGHKWTDDEPGAQAHWTGTRKVVITESKLRMGVGKGSARRPCAKFSYVEFGKLNRTRIMTDDGSAPALDIDTRDHVTKLWHFDSGPQMKVRGTCWLDGVKYHTWSAFLIAANNHPKCKVGDYGHREGDVDQDLNGDVADPAIAGVTPKVVED